MGSGTARATAGLCGGEGLGGLGRGVDPRGPSPAAQDDTPSKEGDKGKVNGNGNGNGNGKGNGNGNGNGSGKGKGKRKGKGKGKGKRNSNSRSNSNSQCGDSSLRSE